MMVARAIQRNSAAIELETVTRRERDGTEAEGLVVDVDGPVSLTNRRPRQEKLLWIVVWLTIMTLRSYGRT